MKVLKRLLGLLILLAGFYLMLEAFWVTFKMHAIDKTYRYQDFPVTLGNIVGSVLIAAGAYWICKKGWKLMKSRNRPVEDLGRTDILDDGEIHQKPDT